MKEMKFMKCLLASVLVCLIASAVQAGPLQKLQDLKSKVVCKVQNRHHILPLRNVEVTVIKEVTRIPPVPVSAPCAPACPCNQGVVGIGSDDQADLAEAVARGFHSRIPILGRFREVSLDVRDWRAGDGNDVTKLQARLGRRNLTPCQKATAALIALEMVNAFSPGTIPQSVIDMAVAWQKAACGY